MSPKTWRSESGYTLRYTTQSIKSDRHPDGSRAPYRFTVTWVASIDIRWRYEPSSPTLVGFQLRARRRVGFVNAAPYGDPDFDAEVGLLTPDDIMTRLTSDHPLPYPAHWVATLSPGGRGAITTLFAAARACEAVTVSIDHEAVYLSVAQPRGARWSDAHDGYDASETQGETLQNIRAFLPLMRAVAQALDWTGRDLVSALYRNATEDPVPTLRRYARDHLLLCAPWDHPLARGMAAEGVESLDPMVRVVAAARLGGGGASVLPEVEEALRRPIPPEDIDARRALLTEALTAVLGRADARFAAALNGSPGLADAVMSVLVDAVSAARPPWASGWLGEAFSTHEASRVAIARALCRLEAPGVEAAVLSALAHTSQDARPLFGPKTDEPVIVALLEHLGKVGTVTSIPTLKIYCDELFDPPAPKAAAKASIAQIKARLGAAHAGQLSVVNDETRRGGLSEPEGDG